jgi:hypothetical protein
VTGSTTVQLRGDDQTRPGRGGRLQLIAQQGTTVLATSRGFSVAAIPHTFSTTFLARVTDPAKRGIEVSFGWQSDSGQVGDLDEVTMAEEIEDTLVSGCFVGNSGNVAPRPPVAATAPPLKDTHSSRVATMTREGRQVTRQVARFDDKRSGGAGLPVPNSGYEISRRVDDLPFGLGRLFTITKEGQATTANGIASAAGVGSITRIQSV